MVFSRRWRAGAEVSVEDGQASMVFDVDDAGLIEKARRFVRQSIQIF